MCLIKCCSFHLYQWKLFSWKSPDVGELPTGGARAATFLRACPEGPRLSADSSPALRDEPRRLALDIIVTTDSDGGRNGARCCTERHMPDFCSHCSLQVQAAGNKGSNSGAVMCPWWQPWQRLWWMLSTTLELEERRIIKNYCATRRLPSHPSNSFHHHHHPTHSTSPVVSLCNAPPPLLLLLSSLYDTHASYLRWRDVYARMLQLPAPREGSRGEVMNKLEPKWRNVQCQLWGSLMPLLTSSESALCRLSWGKLTLAWYGSLEQSARSNQRAGPSRQMMHKRCLLVCC